MFNKMMYKILEIYSANSKNRLCEIIVSFLVFKIWSLRRLFDKYLCLSTDDTTDEKCFRRYLTLSFKRWLPKFQTDLSSSVVLIAAASRQIHATMEKKQYRSVIRFLFFGGKTCEEIKVKLHAVYKDHTPTMTTLWLRLMNSSVAEHSFLMTRPSDWGDYGGYGLINSWFRVSRPPGKDQRDCWHCRPLNWTHTKYATRKIGHCPRSGA